MLEWLETKLQRNELIAVRDRVFTHTRTGVTKALRPINKECLGKDDARAMCPEHCVETLRKHDHIGSLSCRLRDMHPLICTGCINCWDMHAQDAGKKGFHLGTAVKLCQKTDMANTAHS